MEELLGLLMGFLSLFGNSLDSVKKVAAAIAAFVLLFMCFGAMMAGGDGPDSSRSSFSTAAFVFFVAAMGCFAVIIVPNFQEKAAIGKLRTASPEDARLIIEHVRSSGKLSDEASPLVRANCAGAHLAGIDFRGAYLQMVGLEAADLQHAKLCGANLRSAHLEGADLRESDLSRATLCYASLQNADLRGARLDNADLTATDLSHAQLEGAIASGTHFDIYTTLPDGRKWSEKIELAKYGIQSDIN